MLKAKFWTAISMVTLASVSVASAYAIVQIRARSLASLMAEERDNVLGVFASEPEERVVLMGTSFPSLPTIRYAGSSRPTPAQHIDVIRRWVRSYGMDAPLVDDFRTEMLFTEDSLRLWLPVHSDLVEAIETDRADSMTLFLVWAGTRRDRDDLDWVFIVYGVR